MSQPYYVRVSKDHFVFSAAHFITYGGNICERLHGHNYRVAAEVHGPLDENQYVVDFIALRDTLIHIVGQLDHRMLLPDSHPQIRVARRDTELEVTFEDRRWVFPEDECVLLPVSNTTTELLARYIGLRLLEELEARTGMRPSEVKVEVDENYGQIGVCHLKDP